MFVFGGDFNVTRYSNATASQILWRFCNYNNLLWLETKSDEIGYTFHNDANRHFSLIAHFLCSPSLSGVSNATGILAYGDNTSDHLAISSSY